MTVQPTRNQPENTILSDVKNEIKTFDSTWFDLKDPLKEPLVPLEFVIDGFAARSGITVLGGASGSGKSILTQYLFSDQDNSILDVAPNGQALYLVGADAGEQELIRRAHSIKKNHGLKMAALPEGQLCTTSNELFMNELTQQIQRENITAVIFDTIADFHEGNTYEAELVNKTMARFRKLAEQTKAAIILITHTKKGSKIKEKYNVEDIADSRIWTTKSDFIFALKSEYQEDGSNLIELQCLKSRSPVPLNAIRMTTKYSKALDQFSIEHTDKLFEYELKQEDENARREATIAECKRLSDEGKTQRQIGETLGISAATVNKYLKKSIQPPK